MDEPVAKSGGFAVVAPRGQPYCDAQSCASAPRLTASDPSGSSLRRTSRWRSTLHVTGTQTYSWRSAPGNAHTTASDALWMGEATVLTVTGETFAGRVATSLLHAVGLSRLCTASIPDYVDLSAGIGEDTVRIVLLEGASRYAAGARSPCSIPRGVLPSNEAAFQEICARQARGESPSTLICSRAPDSKGTAHDEQQPRIAPQSIRAVRQRIRPCEPAGEGLSRQKDRGRHPSCAA